MIWKNLLFFRLLIQASKYFSHIKLNFEWNNKYIYARAKNIISMQFVKLHTNINVLVTLFIFKILH